MRLRARPARHPRGMLAVLGPALAAAVVVAGIALAGPSAQAVAPTGAPAAVPQVAAATTVTQVNQDGRTMAVSVSPNADLPPAGAQVTVTGTGFDPGVDLWVAICQDDGVAPAALLHCIGGAIPHDNSTAGWGVVTDDQEAPYPGPVTTHWRRHGSFQLTLQVPSALSESADCLSAPCAVYTRSSDNTDRSEDVAVPVSFAAPPTSSSGATSSSNGASSQQSEPSTSSSVPTTSTEPTTPTEPSTQTFGAAPTTVTPDSISRTSVTVGAKQTVVFTGFTPGEKVRVTLYSKPIKLHTAKADADGHVRISFTIPAKLPPGEHILQAVGSKSRRVGIARFAVGAAAVSSTTTVSATTSTAASTATVTQSAAVVASSVLASSAPASPSVADTTAIAGASAASVASGIAASGAVVGAGAPTTTAISSTSDAAAGGRSIGHRLLWLWIVLGILIVIGGTAGVVAMVRHRRDAENDLPVTAVGMPPAPGWDAAPPASPPQPPAPADHDPGAFGLLSGREHPDGPVLYSGGGWPDRPTTVDPGAVTAPGEPPTQQWRPEFTGPTPPAGGVADAGDDAAGAGGSLDGSAPPETPHGQQDPDEPEGPPRRGRHHSD